MAESRRERERVLADYRKQAEEKKDFKEKVEKRVSLSQTLSPSCSSDIVFLLTSSARPPPTTPLGRVSQICCRYL